MSTPMTADAGVTLGKANTMQDDDRPGVGLALNADGSHALMVKVVNPSEGSGGASGSGEPGTLTRADIDRLHDTLAKVLAVQVVTARLSARTLPRNEMNARLAAILGVSVGELDGVAIIDTGLTL